jgi:hypothetical protein
MPGIDKAAFLKKIAGKKPADAMPGEGSPEEEASEPADEAAAEGDVSCGEQLQKALDSRDPQAIDDALREAVAKYSGGGGGY